MNKSDSTPEAIRKTLDKIYGRIPPRPEHLSHKNECINEDYAAGKATYKNVEILLEIGGKETIMPIKSVIPKGKLSCPVIVYLSDEENIPNRFLPVEEIIDRGYGIISLFINDISENDGNFKTKISGKIARSRKKKDAAGKIAVWAWALMRVVDYLCNTDDIDKDKIILAGHGIFARATMLAAAFDERVKYVIANGISSYPPTYSAKNAQSCITVRDYPHLYCPSFINEPFGEEFYTLMWSCSSRNILIGASEDGYMSNPSYEINCITELYSEETKMQKEFLTAPMQIDKENISYHLRSGTDYFSREDWNIYLNFIDKNQ